MKRLALVVRPSMEATGVGERLCLGRAETKDASRMKRATARNDSVNMVRDSERGDVENNWGISDKRDDISTTVSVTVSTN